MEKMALPAVLKFSYIKKLPATKVKVLINGLPFNAEGYETVKVTLENTNGKPIVVAKAHVQEIFGLPNITHYNILKIQKFNKKLIINIQSLGTTGKLSQITEYVQITTNKLQPIRADLIRLDTKNGHFQN